MVSTTQGLNNKTSAHTDDKLSGSSENSCKDTKCTTLHEKYYQKYRDGECCLGNQIDLQLIICLNRYLGSECSCLVEPADVATVSRLQLTELKSHAGKLSHYKDQHTMKEVTSFITLLEGSLASFDDPKEHTMEKEKEVAWCNSCKTCQDHSTLLQAWQKIRIPLSLMTCRSDTGVNASGLPVQRTFSSIGLPVEPLLKSLNLTGLHYHHQLWDLFHAQTNYYKSRTGKESHLYQTAQNHIRFTYGAEGTYCETCKNANQAEQSSATLIYDAMPKCAITEPTYGEADYDAQVCWAVAREQRLDKLSVCKSDYQAQCHDRKSLGGSWA